MSFAVMRTWAPQRCATRQLSRQMSAASPALLKQYRATAEDRLLAHVHKAARHAHSKGELEQSHELYSHLVMTYRMRDGDRHPLTVSAIGSLSTVAKDLGDLDSAEELAREATLSATETLGAIHPVSLKQLSLLSAVLADKGKLDEAETTARSVVEGYREMSGSVEPHADLADAECALGEVVRARTLKAA